MPAINKEIPKPSPAEFTEHYPSVRPDLILNKQKPPDSPEMARYVRLCQEVDDQMERSGYYKAVVINLQPFALHVNGVLVDHMLVPAVDEDSERDGHVHYFDTEIDGRKVSIPYVAYLIPHYVQDKKDLGDFNFVPYAEPPSKLAYDFEHEFVGENKPGGVFFYLGNGLPGDGPDLVNPDVKMSRAIKGESEVTVRQLFQKGYKQMVRWAQAKFREADAEYNKPNGQRGIINKFHRDAVKTLVRLGYMNKDKTPPWFSMTQAESSIGQDCPVCKKQSPNGAIGCGNCNYIFDVAGAYDAGVIGHDSTYLRRMSVEDMLQRELDPALYKPGYRGPRPTWATQAPENPPAMTPPPAAAPAPAPAATTEASTPPPAAAAPPKTEKAPAKGAAAKQQS